MRKKIDLPQYLKVRFLELGTQIVRDEYFRRIKNSIDARRNLEELPELLEFVDNYYGTPPQDFEERLNKFAERSKDGSKVG